MARTKDVEIRRRAGRGKRRGDGNRNVKAVEKNQSIMKGSRPSTHRVYSRLITQADNRRISDSRRRPAYSKPRAKSSTAVAVGGKRKRGGKSMHNPAPMKKKRRWRPGTCAIREIRKCQNEVYRYIPKSSFGSLVRETVQNIMDAPIKDVRFTKGAMEALHEGAEQYLVNLLNATQIAALHADHETIKPGDMQMVLAVQHGVGSLRPDTMTIGDARKRWTDLRRRSPVRKTMSKRPRKPRKPRKSKHPIVEEKVYDDDDDDDDADADLTSDEDAFDYATSDIRSELPTTSDGKCASCDERMSTSTSSGTSSSTSSSEDEDMEKEDDDDDDGDARDGTSHMDEETIAPTNMSQNVLTTASSSFGITTASLGNEPLATETSRGNTD